MVLLLALAGCAAPQIQPSPEPFLEPQIQEKLLQLSDGYRLPLSRWMPDRPPRAVVLALHGFNDYRLAFRPLGEYLAKHGIATYAYDQRGFGGSPHRGVWPGTERLVADVLEAIQALATRHPDQPIYLVGESMGAAVAMVAIRQPMVRDPAGLVLLAPAVWGRDSMNPLMRAALWIGVRTAPGRYWTGEGLDIRPTDNMEALRRMARDPLVIKRSRTDALWGVTNLMDRATISARSLNRPSLILYGLKDEVIPTRPTCRMLGSLPTDAPAAIAVYPQGYHLLMQDHQAAHVLRDIRNWLEHPATGLAPAAYRLPAGAWPAALCSEGSARATREYFGASLD